LCFQELTKTIHVQLTPGNGTLVTETSLDYEIKCEAVGKGVSNWYRKDSKTNALTLITDNVRLVQLHTPRKDKLYLEFKSITSKDSGMYTCRRRNHYGAVDSKDIQVIVKGNVHFVGNSDVKLMTVMVIDDVLGCVVGSEIMNR